jgi:uncharacterized glyoxalase superfamily protein PhnB
MPTIENLKKQAKALVRLHRQRSYHLSSVARDVLPKFAGVTDREILAGAFTLADAQEILARQHGASSWRELKARLEAAPPPAAQPQTSPGLVLAQPMLYVADVARALAWYEGVLGFERLMTSGQPPFYAEVRRDAVVLSLRLVHGHAIDPAVRARETMLLQANVRVTNAKALFLEFTASGAAFDTPLRREPWGALFFVVKDPDDNLIGFGEAAPAGG